MWFNGESFEYPLNFELSGILLGLSIYNAVILDLHFPTVIYKKLLDKAVGIEDVKKIDPELYKGFIDLLEFDGDVKSTFCRNFEIEYESFGMKLKHILKVKPFLFF